MGKRTIKEVFTGEKFVDVHPVIFNSGSYYISLPLAWCKAWLDVDNRWVTVENLQHDDPKNIGFVVRPYHPELQTELQGILPLTAEPL